MFTEYSITATCPLGKGVLQALRGRKSPILSYTLGTRCYLCDSLSDLNCIAEDLRLSVATCAAESLLQFSEVIASFTYGNRECLVGGRGCCTADGVAWIKDQSGIEPAFPQIDHSQMVFWVTVLDMHSVREGGNVNRVQRVVLDLDTLKMEIVEKATFVTPRL